MKKILFFFHFESQLCPLTTVSPVNVELVCVTNSLQAGRSSWFPGLFLLRTFSFVVTVDGVDVIRKSPTVIDGKMLSTVLIWRPWGKIKMTALVILVQRLSIVVWQPMKYLLTKFVTVCSTPLLSLRLEWKPVEAHDQTYITFFFNFPKTKRTVKGSGFQSSDQTKTWYQRLQIYT